MRQKAGIKTAVTFPLALALLCLAAAGLCLFLGADGGTMVYVTNTGKKYHRDACPSLSRSKVAVALEDAVRSGYGPCGICRPPSLSGENAAAPPPSGAPPALYRVNAAELAASADADVTRMTRAQVVDHVDGDTVRVRIAGAPPGLGALETIRLIGVDTPETVHPRQPVQRFGREASDYTKTRLLNKTVYLAFDWNLRDRYGRLLAYVYTAAGDGTNARCFNAALIRDGYAHAYTRFAFQFIEEFRALEAEARRETRGLWGPQGSTESTTPP
jgi:micrococcal nuclease